MTSWIRYSLWAVLLAVGVSPAWAANEFYEQLLQNAVVATADGTTLPVDRFTAVAVDVKIVTTATITFEGSVMGTDWTAIACILSSDGSTSSTATASGIYQCNVAGLLSFRARVSAWTSGAVTVFARATTAVITRAGTGVSGWPTVYSVKEITWANSLANAARIGDGTTPICLYTDATLGPQVRPCTDANVATIIPTNFNWSLFDIEGGLPIETVDPDAATTALIWTYPNAAYRPKKSIWFGAGSLDGDGVQCPALATTVTINSGPKIPTFICTENDASTLYGAVKLVDNWDAGTITVTHVYIQTAADTGSMLGEVSMQCHGNGEVVDSTYGTMVELDDAAVTGSSKNDMITSTAVTPAGTCAAGDMLYFRWQYDGTGNPTTAAATLNHVGFMLKYSETSRSH